MANAGLISTFAAIKERHAKSLDELLDLKAHGADFVWHDGRTVDDLIEEEQRAIDNLKHNIARLQAM